MESSKQIENMKQDLDELILQDADYEKIYKLSIELDELIVKYYKDKTCKAACE